MGAQAKKEKQSFDLAISPCPNDTFAFYGLLHGKTGYVPSLDVRFDDIEALNRTCLGGQPDFCKVSFHAYVYLRDRYQLLNAGAALGFGCGPLLVARRPQSNRQLSGKTIAVPGFYTTATLLLKLYLPGDIQLVEMPFDRIMPAVATETVDAGLIIHESRFTYADHGLVSLVDLGDWWERRCGLPIPLGGIVARKSLPEREVHAFDRALGQSIDYAWAHEAETLPFMRKHAQEMDAAVMRRHVELYVNQFTRDLGTEGRAAVDYLVSETKRTGQNQEPFTR